MSSGGAEPQRSLEVAALLAGEKIRPVSGFFCVGSGLVGLTFLGGGIGMLILGGAAKWGASGWFMCLICAAAGVAILAYTWAAKAHVAIQVSDDGLTYWDLRGRSHAVRWDEITEASWSMRGRDTAWDLSLSYRPRYATEREERWLDLRTSNSWRPEIADALGDEIVARSGLGLVSDRLWMKVWRRPDSRS